jgi:hypothetical protein
MDHNALQAPESYSRYAFDHAERCVERAADATMTAMLAWAQMRAARERLRELAKTQTRAVTIAA